MGVGSLLPHSPRLSGLAASAFTCWSILSSLFFGFILITFLHCCMLSSTGKGGRILERINRESWALLSFSCGCGERPRDQGNTGAQWLETRVWPKGRTTGQLPGRAQHEQQGNNWRELREDPSLLGGETLRKGAESFHGMGRTNKVLKPLGILTLF